MSSEEMNLERIRNVKRMVSTTTCASVPASRPKRICPEFLEPERFARGDVLDFTPGNPWNKMFSRNLVERLGFGFLDLPRSEDVGFVFPALAAAKRVAMVEKPLVNYRTDNSRSLEHTKGEAGCLVFYEAYLSVRDRLRELGIYDRVRASFMRLEASIPLQYNFADDNFPYTFFGLNPDVTKKQVKECMANPLPLDICKSKLILIQYAA